MNKNPWGFTAQIFFIAGSIILFLLILTYSIIKTGNLKTPLTYLSLLLLFLLVFLTFYNLYLIYKKNMDMRDAFQKSLVLSLDEVQLQMEMSLTLFSALEKIKDVEKNDEMNQKFELLKEKVEKIKTSIIDFNQYKKSILKTSRVNKLVVEDKLNELIRDALEMKEETLTLADDFVTAFIKNKSMVDYVNLDMSTLIYYLGVSIPILYDFTGIFNEFTKNLILDIINKFTDITNSSHKISNEIEASMNNLMDTSNSNSLAYIIKKAQGSGYRFREFYKEYGKAENSF